jgi:hypothetical protein
MTLAFFFFDKALTHIVILNHTSFFKIIISIYVLLCQKFVILVVHRLCLILMINKLLLVLQKLGTHGTME